ncbi:MAG: hypothetical protein H8E37_00455 [Planctomycetes bacterium]|nr:hypothetical protein [Planctomycetota bacterium]
MRPSTANAFLLATVAFLLVTVPSGNPQKLAAEDRNIFLTNTVPKNAKELKEFRAQLDQQLKAFELKKFKSAQDRLAAERRIVAGHRQLDVHDPQTVLGKLAAKEDETPSEITTSIFGELLGRQPEEREIELCQKHFKKKDAKRLEAIEDIVWAILATREFMALLRNPLPPQLDTTKIEATFYDRTLRKEISFAVPRSSWRNITLPLLPAEVDPKPAKWKSVGSLTIHSKTEGPVHVGLYAPSKGSGAFSVRLAGVKEKVYYRGGSSKVLMEQLKEAHQAATGVAKPVKKPVKSAAKSKEARGVVKKTNAKSE